LLLQLARQQALIRVDDGSRKLELVQPCPGFLRPTGDDRFRTCPSMAIWRLNARTG
jgi:hypothetical protein